MKRFARSISCTLLFLLFGGCGQHPHIDVTSGIENGRVVFDLTTSDINGLLGFVVMEGTNTIWEISTSYEKGTRIVYGVLPNGGNMAARQVFPSAGGVPASVDGKVVTVRVDYQYDNDGSACMGHFEKSMRIPNAKPDRSSR
jgi:hypothetical protein